VTGFPTAALQVEWITEVTIDISSDFQIHRSLQPEVWSSIFYDIVFYRKLFGLSHRRLSACICLPQREVSYMDRPPILNRRGYCERHSFCPSWVSNQRLTVRSPARYSLSHRVTFPHSCSCLLLFNAHTDSLYSLQLETYDVLGLATICENIVRWFKMDLLARLPPSIIQEFTLLMTRLTTDFSKAAILGDLQVSYIRQILDQLFYFIVLHGHIAILFNGPSSPAACLSGSIRWQVHGISLTSKHLLTLAGAHGPSPTSNTNTCYCSPWDVAD